MEKKKIRLFLVGVLIFIIIVGISTAVIFAAPNINLKSKQDGNKLNLSWKNNDNTSTYNYRVLRSVNGGSFNGLSATNTDKIKVLNIHPTAGGNIVFTSSNDGKSYTLPKSASLKMWMEKANSYDSRGYGRGLINVDSVSFTNFNANPSAYLKQSGGKYNYNVIMFGTWDSNNSEDINATSLNTIKQYLNSGGGAIFGHDTVNESDKIFSQLQPYINLTHTESKTQEAGAGVCNVVISKNGTFTTYPWNIGTQGAVLSVPQTHSWNTNAAGDIWLRFQGWQYNANNFYLTTYNNCAVIQTGHSSGAATDDEQKILANLIFYLADVKASTSDVDTNFIDINAPNNPTEENNTLNGINGTITYSATDNGTTYKYYVEATELASQTKTNSNTVTEVRITGVAGYSYVIDTNATTEPDNISDTTSTSINYTLGNGPKTYLHIKTIDGAGNVSGTTHILLHNNVAPKLTLTQDITEWTNQDVTITATGTDVDGTVITVKKPDGTIVNGASTTYTTQTNGIYEFEVTDNSGATTKKSIEITNIDKVKPEGTATITQPTALVRAAIINFSATDDASGVAKIIKPDGTEITEDNTTYSVTTPGKYTFKVVDKAGNEKIVDIDVVIVSDGVEAMYVDQVTREEIASKEIISGNVGDDYITTAKNITDYTLTFVSDNSMGTMTIDKILVTYEYRKLSNVIVKYIDENTNTEIIPDVVTKYKEGDTYITEQKSFEGYILVGKTTNTTGTIGREDITVTYKYKRASAGVEIKYIDQVTGDIIADTIIKSGYDKTPYTSEPKKIDGYELVKTPQNANGEMTITKINVVYEYRKNSNVKTRYLDENSGKELAASINKKYKEGDTYTTIKEEIPDYTFTKVMGTPEGTVGRENIVITYYYKKNTYVTVKYVDMLNSNKEISETVVISGLEGQEYSTELINIDGYIFEASEGITNGKMSFNPTEVKYKYKKASNLITEHIDENSGEKIIEDVVKAYKEGDTYEAFSQNLSGYILVKGPDEKAGIMERKDVIKTFYYKKISGGLVVKYVDKVSGEVLSQQEYTGKESDVIKLEEKVIDGYVLDERPDFTEVILGVQPQEVTFYYKRAIVIDVIGIDQETGEEIYKESISGIEGNEYSTSSRELNEYKLVKIPDNRNGIFSRNSRKIIYTYRRLSGELVVKYIDKETNEELDRYTISGKVGDSFQTEKRDFKDYNFIEVVGDEVGILTKDKKEVIYYYTKKVGNLIVRYIDLDGNEILREETTKKVGEKYKIEEKEIKGYTILERPISLEGEYKEGTIELIFLVSKDIVKPIEKGKIIVKFVDENGNKIKEDYTEENEVGNKFYFELPNIEGYEVVGDKVIEALFENGEIIFTVEYKKIEENIIIGPVTGDINVILYMLIVVMSIIGIFMYIRKYKKK